MGDDVEAGCVGGMLRFEPHPSPERVRLTVGALLAPGVYWLTVEDAAQIVRDLGGSPPLPVPPIVRVEQWPDPEARRLRELQRMYPDDPKIAKEVAAWQAEQLRAKAVDTSTDSDDASTVKEK